MELKQRKRVMNDLPKFDTGTDLYNITKNVQNQYDYNLKDQILQERANYKPYTNLNEKSAQSSLSFAAPAMLTQGIQFTGDAIKAFGPVKSEGELLSDSGTGQGSVMGVGYETQNSIDTGAQMDQLRAENTSNTMSTVSSGAALGGTVGSIIPGVGTALGTVGGAIIGGIAGIFGSSRRKRKLKQKMIQANLLAQRTNMFNRTSAMSGAMEQNWALEHSNTQDDILYANRGKDLKQPKYNRL